MTGDLFGDLNWGTILAPLAELRDCSICPRECHVDRESPKLGFCQSGVGFAVSSIFAHRGEEPALSGKNGICNIFFSHCNMQCRYCQNCEISRNREDTVNEITDLREILRRVLAILDTGIKLIGFVSPSHFIPQMKAIMTAVRQLRPETRFVFNNGGYDKVDVIKSLEGQIAVYLPDLKYMDESLAREYSQAPRYPEFATACLREMFRQKGANLFVDDDEVAESGLIIRHLVLPGQIENSKAVLRFIADELSPSVHVSLMSQYWPTPKVYNHPQLGRYLYAEEYEEVVDEFERLGFYRGWVQELGSPNHYRPQFSQDAHFDES